MSLCSAIATNSEIANEKCAMCQFRSPFKPRNPHEEVSQDGRSFVSPLCSGEGSSERGACNPRTLTSQIDNQIDGRRGGPVSKRAVGGVGRPRARVTSPGLITMPSTKISDIYGCARKEVSWRNIGIWSDSSGRTA